MTTQELQENLPDKNLIENRYAYTGRELEDETGLYYYRARYYDPELGRFISEDPIGFDGGEWSLYNYVKNNPISFTDPMGLRGGITSTLINDIGGGGGGSCGPLTIAPIIPIISIIMEKENVENPARDCSAERVAAWAECNRKFREIHDGSQGKCYAEADRAYNLCKKSGGK